MQRSTAAVMSRFLLRGFLRKHNYCSARPAVAVPAAVGPTAVRRPTVSWRRDSAGSPLQSSALAEKPLGEILRSWMVFKLLSYDWIVRNSLSLYQLSKRILGGGITRQLLRISFGGQFLGGFSEEEARDVAQLLASRKLCSIWNFSTEQYLSEGDVNDQSQQEARYDKVTDRYLKSISQSGMYNYLESPIKTAAVKLTAIVQPHILLKLSQMLEAVQSPMEGQGLGELTQAGEVKRMEVAQTMSLFKVGEDLSALEEASHQVQSCDVSPWTASEREQFARLIERLDTIGECAVREGVRVMVDAEEFRLQPAIHHLTVHHMMPRFNISQPFIYNTSQMYLKTSLEALLIGIAAAKTTGFSYGAKLVRGAYMHHEKEISEERGLEYPIHPSKEATDANYDQGVRSVLEELARGTPESGVGGLLVATHNRQSVEKAMKSMKELGIPHNTGIVCFGQQTGMADYIAYDLISRGYNMQKVLAYGEEEDVVPFLVRRARENNKTSQTAQLERQLYGEELKRRMRIMRQ